MKNYLSLLGIALLSANAIGQESEKASDVRPVYETNRFRDNWFIQGSLGGSLYLGGAEGSIGKSISPTFELNVGKWFSPSAGLRFGLNYTPSVNEYSNMTGKFVNGTVGADGLFNHKFNTAGAHIDFMWNVCAEFGGYNPKRVYELIPYLGLGMGLNTYPDKERDTELSGNFGLLNKFRVSRSVDINLDLRATTYNGRFDGLAHYNRFDVPVSAMVGITYRFGKRKEFKKVEMPAPADYTPYRNRIQELENSNSNLDNKARQLSQEVEDLKNRKVESVTSANKGVKTVASPVVVFFEKGKSGLDSKELINLDFYVKNAIKADKDKIFTLIGMGDKDTGTAEVNQRISEQRVEFVYDLLINKYGISKDRLIKKAIGATDNRFAEPRLNRAVIIE